MNLIREAMGILEKRGMARGRLEDEHGRVCMNGALNCAQHANAGWKATNRDRIAPELRQAVQIVAAVVQEQFPERWDAPWEDSLIAEAHTVAHFNNHQDTTILDALRVLDKAAVRLDEVV